MASYYNEFDPKAVAGLRALIEDGLIPPGEVDTRSIIDVRPDDLKGFTQCHFFAGIGGWSHALQLADWSADRPVWTGSCPCQPFSSAGKQKGGADDRDLWPVWFRLISECRPAIVFGEQVASAIPHGWLDRVYSDMEAAGYACGSAVLPACAVNAPHRRDRLWYVAHRDADGRATLPVTGQHGEKHHIEPCGSVDNAIGNGRRARRQDDAEHDGVKLDAAGKQLMAHSTSGQLQESIGQSETRDGAGSIGATVAGGALADSASIGSWSGLCEAREIENRHGASGACDRDCQDYPPLNLWTTPSTRDHKDSAGMTAERKDGKSRHDQLPRQVFGTTTNGSSAPTEKKGASPQLNPEFVFWLMGYPKEWVSCVQRGMQSCQKSRRGSSKPAGER